MLLAVVALLLASHSLGYLFERFRLPRVVGEIGGGLLLGPSVLGHFLPQAEQWTYSGIDDGGRLLGVLYWLGLTLLMFTAGFHVKTRFGTGARRLILYLLIGATVVPVLAGALGVHLFDLTRYAGPNGNFVTLTMVIAVAAAVTSIPVISRIFMDLGIMETRFAGIVIATSTVQDLLLWVVLAVATGLAATGTVSAETIGYTALKTIVFLSIALIAGPRLLRFLSGLRLNLLLKASRAGYALFLCFLLAALASLLNVNIIFGAFVAGILIGTLPDTEFADVRSQITEISRAFFVPIYFALVGYRINLPVDLDVSLFLGFLILTSLVECASVVVAVRLAGQGWRSSTNFAIAMNTRGGPGIVLASVAFEFGIINQTMFTTLVLSALVTSLISGAWFHRLVIAKRPLMDPQQDAPQ